MIGLPYDRNAPKPSLLKSSIQEVPGVLSLALPIIVGLASSTLIGVIDTIMIAPLGTAAMAAAGITTSALIIFYSAVFGLLSIIGIKIAQAKGAEDEAGVSSSLIHGLITALGVGVIAAIVMMFAFPALSVLDQPEEVMAALLPYWLAKSGVLVLYALLTVFRGFLNAVDRPWTASAVSFGAVLANIPLNYVFIGGLGEWNGLGLFGAGLASLLANLFALALFALIWRLAAGLERYHQKPKIRFGAVWRNVAEGAPVSLSYAGEGASYALAGLMLGFFGPAALAANQVVHSIAAILYMLPIGMASAVSVRVGQAIGAKETQRLRSIGTAASGLLVSWLGVIAIALLFVRGDIAESLSHDPEVIAIAVNLFLATAFMQVADGLQSTSVGALRGMLDVRIPAIVSLIAYWLFALPAGYGLGFVLGYGPSGVWIGYGLGIFAAAAFLQHRFWKLTALEK
ncbi:MAG: MATE family efflux transporter [Pseudomonadota bacterium]